MSESTGKKKWIIIVVAIVLAVILAVDVVIVLMFKDTIFGTKAPTTQNTTQATTTVETTIETTTAPTEPPILYRHPLNGTPIDAPLTTRPVAISINNIQACLPQYGVSKADILYEIETEGGITRFCGLFTNLGSLDQVGPIRSARSYFNNVSAAYDAPLVHCGGSKTGIKGYYDFTHKLTDWEHLSVDASGDDPKKVAFRDLERYRELGYNWEHTLFGRGPKLLSKLKKTYGLVEEKGVDYGLTFEDAVVARGETAENITIKFLGTKKTKMKYDATTGKYVMSEYGKDLVDAIDGSTVSFNNVMVIKADQTKKRFNGKGTLLSYYDMIGSGDGYLAINGKIEKIKWSRKKVTEPFSYTYADGSAVTFNVGNTYVAVVDFEGTVTYK
ncbi:MAG: DUF3048 domain-containing protein [Oscillospiraceae bacterium]|nr:DUF3048 domain-containing protein [Oscillospiraceae bacterium]